MHRRSYYIVNGITVYRLVMAPLLVLLVIDNQVGIFKWLLAISFFTDAIDGYLARKYKVVSVLGARLDSIADDFTVTAAIIAMAVWKPGFLKEQIVIIIILLILFLLQISLAFLKYKKLTSFHTYGAKAAAIAQGVFLILFFFLNAPSYLSFYIATGVTILELIEETVLVVILPKWQTDIKGLFWILQKRQKTSLE